MTLDVLDAARLERARLAIASLRPTRLVREDRLPGRPLVKLETEQPTGSFKVRGALARLAALDASERARGVVAASAGNHGYGVAWAASRLQVRATVVVPETSPQVKRDGIASAGAEVVVVPGGYDEADERARALAAQRGALFVSPYDDADVALGNGGTLALEVIDVAPQVNELVVPVGGGGLAVGIAAAYALRQHDARVVAVQSAACPAMHDSLRKGHALERFAGEPSVAEGLEGGVAPDAFSRFRELVGNVQLVTEERTRDAMRFAREELGLVIEGSAAVALAWWLGHPRPRDGEHACIVVTGRNVD